MKAFVEENEKGESLIHSLDKKIYPWVEKAKVLYDYSLIILFMLIVFDCDFGLNIKLYLIFQMHSIIHKTVTKCFTL